MAGMVVGFDRSREDVADSVMRRMSTTRATQRARFMLGLTTALSILIGVLLGIILATNLLFGLAVTVGVALVLSIALPRRLLAATSGPRSRLAQRILETSSDAVFGHVSVTLQPDGVQTDAPIGSQFIRWSVIKEMRDDARGVAFIIDQLNIVFVPSRAFALPAERQAFVAEARDHPPFR